MFLIEVSTKQQYDARKTCMPTRVLTNISLLSLHVHAGLIMIAIALKLVA